MPTYSYRCANRHETTKFFRVREYVEAVDCEQCDLAAVRIFTPPVMVKVQADICYDSPVDGRVITSHAARRDDLKRHDCIEYDPQMKTDAVRKQRERTEQLDQAVEETVYREVAKLPKAKKDQLIKEVVNQGMSVEAVRGGRN